ncbi:MAG: hypothetical protein C3F12_10390 [Candidatus Methylomirabilota bacterium]|nr:hypothetical protein [Candidatus Methylomirabilis sp.]NJD67811.1 hypothetical protein [candidate division NC10 bacterium]PWB44796.1 MAG: hypothetical protein C3F12_10390 [candidate division NC10 bacterium]
MMVCILAAVVGCTSETTPTTPPAVQQTAPPPAPEVASHQEEREERATYRSRGRRDPFRPSRSVVAETPPTVPLTVTGIIREARSFYALVESELSAGRAYIIRENDVVDSAKVVKISRDRVVFEVRTKNPEGKVRIRYVEKQLPADVPR